MWKKEKNGKCEGGDVNKVQKGKKDGPEQLNTEAIGRRKMETRKRYREDSKRENKSKKNTNHRLEKW